MKTFFLSGLAIPVALAIHSCTDNSRRSENISTSGRDTVRFNPEKNMAHVLSADSTRIAYEKTGSGPALIIVSGALSQRSLVAVQSKPLIDSLARHFTVYIYDRRGRGESTDNQPYAVTREIEDLDALIRAAGGQAFLYGVSSGGALALQAAAALGPGKVQKLAVYEVPYGQGTQAMEKQKQGIAERIKNGQPGDAAAFFLAEIGTPADMLAGMKASPDWEVMKKIDFTLQYDFQVLGEGAIPASAVNAIAIPTLVMTGEKGLEFIRNTASLLAKQVRNATFETLPGQGHQAEAAVVAPLLIDFFNASLESPR